MSQYTGAVPYTRRTADWRDRALCALSDNRGIDFFPQPGDQQGIAKAVTVCETCPVRMDCLRDALRQEGGSRMEYRHGIRGGLTPPQRRKVYERIMARRRAAQPTTAAEPTGQAKVAKCGTYSGYQKHLREQTDICSPCRQAKNEANRKQKQRQREKTQTAGWRPAQCGTRPGYQRHRKNGEEACEACRKANADADRRLRNTGTTKVLA